MRQVPRGVVSLNSENENNAEERRKAVSSAPQGARNASDERVPRKKSSNRKNSPTPEVGQALRNIYQRTIEENIPSEMLDLLGKLG